MPAKDGPKLFKQCSCGHFEYNLAQVIEHHPNGSYTTHLDYAPCYEQPALIIIDDVINDNKPTSQAIRDWYDGTFGHHEQQCTPHSSDHDIDYYCDKHNDDH